MQVRLIRVAVAAALAVAPAIQFAGWFDGH